MITFGYKHCWIQNKKKKLIGIESPMGKLYKLDFKYKAIVAGGSSKIDLWHQRLAHGQSQTITSASSNLRRS